MEFIVVVLPLLVSLHLLNRQQQQLRIQRLAALLRPLGLEKLMEQLNTGYLRALGEHDPARSQPIWDLLAESERRFGEQLQRLADGAARMDAEQTRVSRWPVWAALAARWLPANSFDLRELLRIHAHGVAEVLHNPQGLARRDQAFMLSADMLLLQHSCQMYCRSRGVASARLLARHQTSHAQALGAASPTTRKAYRALLQMD
ncbi:MAG: hypothetical protein ACI83N_001687 [Hydrogenophaga sp.]|jgi:hypothetical protein